MSGLDQDMQTTVLPLCSVALGVALFAIMQRRLEFRCVIFGFPSEKAHKCRPH